MKNLKPWLYLLFSLSGFAGLIYESVWSHYIKLILGHSAYAQSLVLAIFMGGMAIGAWLVSLVSHRIKNPLLLYAFIEGIIGAFGIFFHHEFIFFQGFLFNLALPITDSPSLAIIMKWTMAAVMLLPQATLLGTTFPLMSAGIIRHDAGHSGHTLGMLYFTNSIGASIGVLFSGFYLIERVGLPGTSLTAGMINILLAMAVWLIAKRPFQVPVSEGTTSNQDQSVISERVLLLVAFLTGTSSFFYEIGWIRMLSLVLGSSVQAFELMISAFIVGLAFGSYYIRKRADNVTNPGIYLAWVQIIMGLLATATLPLYTTSFPFMSFLINGLSKNDAGYVLFNISSHLIALSVMVPATYMAGMTLPLLTNILLKGGGSESAIGRIYAANTCGAIVGVIIALNLVITLLGVKGLIVAGGSIDIALGVLLLTTVTPTIFTQRRFSIIFITVLLGIFLFSQTPFDKTVLSSGVYRFGFSRLSKGARPVYYRDGKTATIALIQYPNGQLGIRTNGKTDAMIAPMDKPYSADEITMVMAAIVPLEFKPDAKTAANIGMGSGLTTHTILAADTISRVDTIEIERCMVEGARGFGKRVERAYNDPRSKIYIDDAKSFFSTHQKHYDIIISEPSNPWVSGVGSLFSYEFYDHVQKYLNDDGILVQWLQLYEINLNDIAMVIKALDKKFSYYRIYNTDNSNILIMASKRNPMTTIDTWIFKNPKLRNELSRIGIDGEDDLQIRYLGEKKVIAPLFYSFITPMNSDYFPYVSYDTPRSRFKNENSVALTWMHIGEIPVLNWLNRVSLSQGISSRGSYFDVYQKQAQANLVISNTVHRIENQRLRYCLDIINNSFLKGSETGEDTIINALQTVASAINPFLSPEQLEPYWSNLIVRYDSGKCTDAVSQWLRLHRAMSQRDAEETIHYANQILSGKELFTNAQRSYLLTALLTAYISNDQYHNALQIIDQYDLGKTIQSAPLDIRMLVALTVMEEMTRDKQEKTKGHPVIKQ
ncbi:MAG TPA: spermidine synthase [Desulfomonilia bacterium]|nr:spermidine synthase [Desulfomonilia bacterium]